MSVSLKIFLTDLGSVKTCQYPTDTYISDICIDIRSKFNYGEGGLGHGLLFKEQGIWLAPNKMIGHYDFKFGDVIEFKKKHRVLKVKTLDDSVKNILVDESVAVKGLVEVICERIGLSNPEEYSLMREEVETNSPGKKDKKLKKLEGISTDAKGWLNPEKTLREQGLAEEDAVILKKKFFFTDQNVDRSDPVQLMMMYTQSLGMILTGKLPVTEAEAAQFGGIELQIKYGNHDPAKHKPGFANFTLDFGDYAEEYYQVETTEGEEISRLISGYIDIIIKKRNQLHTAMEKKTEEKAVVEDFVRPQKSAKVNLVTNQTPAQLAKSIQPVAYAGNIEPVTYDSARAIVADDLETVEGQSLLYKELKKGKATLEGILQDLSTPMAIPTVSNDPASIQWRNETFDLNAENLRAHVTGMMAAIGALLQYADGQSETMEYDKINYYFNAILVSSAEIGQALRVLSSLSAADTVEDPLIAAAQHMVNTLNDFFVELKPVVSGHKILVELHNKAGLVADAGTKIVYQASEMEMYDQEHRVITNAAAEVVSAVTALINSGNNIGDRINNQTAKRTLTHHITLAHQAGDALTVNASVPGKYLIASVCKEQLLEVLSTVKYNCDDVYALCSNCPDETLIQGLQTAINDVDDAIDYLVEKTSAVDSSLETEIVGYYNQINFISGDITKKMETKEELFASAKDMTVNSSRLVECLKLMATSLENEDDQAKMKSCTESLAALTAQMVSATREVITNFENESAKQKLQDSVAQIEQDALKICHPYLQNNLFHRLLVNMRSTILTTHLAVSSARRSQLTNRNRENMVRLAQASKAIMVRVPKALHAIHNLEKDPSNKYYRAVLVENANEFSTPLLTLIEESNKAIPDITDNFNKANLTAVTATLKNDAEYLKILLDEEIYMWQEEDLANAINEKVAIEIVPQNITQAEIDIGERCKSLKTELEEVLAIREERNIQAARSALTKVLTNFHEISAVISAPYIVEQPAIHRDLAHASKDLGDALSSLIELNAAGDHEQMSEKMSIVNKKMKELQEKLPQKRSILEAVENIKMLNVSKPANEYQPSQSAKRTTTLLDSNVQLQTELLSVAAELGAATQTLVTGPRENLTEIKANMQEMQKVFGRLIDVSSGISKSGKGLDALASVNRLKLNCETLLDGFQEALMETSDEQAEEQLHAAAQDIAKTVEGLFTIFAASNIALDTSSKAVQRLTSANTLVNNINAPKAKEVCYDELKAETTGAMTSVVNHIEALKKLVETGDSAKIETEGLALASDLEKFVEKSIHAAHLLSAIDPQTQQAQPSSLDQAVVSENAASIRTVVANLPTAPIEKRYEEAATISNLVGTLCSAVSKLETSNETDKELKEQIQVQARELASSAATFIPFVKNPQLSKSPEGKAAMEAANNNFMEKLAEFESVSHSKPLMGKAAKPGKQGAQTQSTFVELNMATIKSAKAAIDLIKNNSMAKSKESLAQNLDSISKNVVAVVTVLNETSPGKKEVETVIENINESNQKIKAAKAKLEEGTLEESNNAADMQTFINGAKNMTENITELVQLSQSEPQRAVKQLEELPERFEFLVMSCLGNLSSVDEGNRVEFAKNMEEYGKEMTEFGEALKEYLADPSLLHLYQLNEKNSIMTEKVEKLVAIAEKVEKKDPLVMKSMAEIQILTKEYGKVKPPPQQSYEPVSVITENIKEFGESMVGRLALCANPNDMDSFGPITQSVLSYYKGISNEAAVIIEQCENEEVKAKLTQDVIACGETISNILNDVHQSSKRKDKEAMAFRINQGTKELNAKLANLSDSISEFATGVVAIKKLEEDIANVCAELDTTVVFSEAKQLNPVIENDSFLNRKEQLLSSATKMQDQILKFAQGTQLTQDNLATLVQSTATYVQDFKLKSTQAAASMTSAESDLQKELLSNVKDITLTMRDFFAYTGNTSGATDSSVAESLETKVQATLEAFKPLFETMQKAEKVVLEHSTKYHKVTQELRETNALLLSSEPALGTALPSDIVSLANDVASSIAALVGKAGSKTEEVSPLLNQLKGEIEDICRAGKAVTVNAPEETAKMTIQAISTVVVGAAGLIEKFENAQASSEPVSMFKIELQDEVSKLTDSISHVVDATAKLVPSGYADLNDPNVVAERELLAAVGVIEAASKKLQSLQVTDGSKKELEDLQYIEQVIEAVKTVAAASSGLVRSATGVQREIIATGKQATPEEKMYFSDGTWSEGLVSAAKLVVGATHDLCETADQFVKNSEPIEKVVVCSKAVSAATVQLVTAAGAKSDPKSAIQLRLRAAAKAVTDATETLVLTSKNTRVDDSKVEQILESGSSHKNKIIEMEIQMKILRLEKELEDARKQLAKMRKSRYEAKQPPKPEKLVTTKTPTAAEFFSNDASSPANVPRTLPLKGQTAAAVEFFTKAMPAPNNMPRPMPQKRDRSSRMFDARNVRIQ